MTKTTKINIFSENIFPSLEIDEKKYIDRAKKILKFYLSELAFEFILSQPHIAVNTNAKIDLWKIR